MGKYTEDSAVKLLNAISGVSVDTKSKVIELNKDAQIGNGTWGKIEYLTKYCDYTHLRSEGKKPKKDEGKKSKKSKGKKIEDNKKSEGK